MFESVVDWFFGLGAQYGVNPVIFGSIYVGAIPFFTLSIGWLVRNARKGKSVAVPTLFAGFFFISAYLYLLIAGQNIPVWVYGVVAALVIFGIYTTIGKVRAQIKAPDGVG